MGERRGASNHRPARAEPRGSRCSAASARPGRLGRRWRWSGNSQPARRCCPFRRRSLRAGPHTGRRRHRVVTGLVRERGSGLRGAAGILAGQFWRWSPLSQESTVETSLRKLCATYARPLRGRATWQLREYRDSVRPALGVHGPDGALGLELRLDAAARAADVGPVHPPLHHPARLRPRLVLRLAQGRSHGRRRRSAW